jgi:YHS domain-containing protein
MFGERKDLAAKTRDPVCGMVIVEQHAFGPEESADGKVWFCSVGCQALYQSQDSREGKEKESGVEA